MKTNTGKYIGYLVSLIGILGILISNEKIRSFLPLEIPEQIQSLHILLVSGGIFIAGIVMALKLGKPKYSKETNQERDIPIYKNNEIVGYRRE